MIDTPVWTVFLAGCGTEGTALTIRNAGTEPLDLGVVHVTGHRYPTRTDVRPFWPMSERMKDRDPTDGGSGGRVSFSNAPNT